MKQRFLTPPFCTVQHGWFFLEMTLPHLAKPSLSQSQTVYKQVCKFKYTYSAGDRFLKALEHLILSLVCSSTFPNQVTFIYQALAILSQESTLQILFINFSGPCELGRLQDHHFKDWYMQFQRRSMDDKAYQQKSCQVPSRLKFQSSTFNISL